MHLDVTKLRHFYYRTKLGDIVQRNLCKHVHEMLGECKTQTVVGYGFSVPILCPFLDPARRVISIMPGQQGVMRWPEGKINRSVLCDEAAWPLATGIVDKMVVLHGLETSDDQQGLLGEIWRVLGPGGRVLFIVPNRLGLWARSDETPFGYGRPFSLRQLENSLRDYNFVIERHMSALFFPPSHRPFWLKIAQLREGFGLRGVIPLASGVIIIEASKKIYARPRSGLKENVKKPLNILEGISTSSKMHD